MMQAQFKLLANFCSDIAKGALLSGLGLGFILPEDITARTLFVIPTITFAICSLLCALEFAKLVSNDQS